MDATSLPLRAVVDTLDQVAATSSRTTKITLLAELLHQVPPAQARALVGILIGQVRQGRVGVGWRTLTRFRDQASDEAGAERLTLLEVDRAFDALVAVEAGHGSAERRQQVLLDLFARATAAESDLLMRVLTAEMRTGALAGLVTDAAARACGEPAAVLRRAVMLSGDLGATVELALSDPTALAQVGLRVGTPVHPMLASPAASVTEALQTTGQAVVEYKLDGARIQVHRDQDHVLVVTRTLADVTDRVPEIVEHARSLEAERFVLDGETLLLDDAGAPRPFQQTMSRFGRHGEAPDQLLAPWYFDLLHLDGRDLLDEPLGTRRELLEGLVGDQLMPGVVTDDPDEAEGMFTRALEAGHEGAVVKGLDSTYAAGRRGKAWLKVKPVHTLDLVVLACEWGSGRRRGKLSNLHLGAYDPNAAPGDPDASFVMVGKTFKGLTDELLDWQTETFPTIAVDTRGHTMRLRPEIVVEIALDGVQASPRYPGGVALRFARVRRYRPDKKADQADTIEAVRAMLRK